MSEPFEMPEANAHNSLLASAAAEAVADAPRGNWVDLYAPAATRPYLRLSRADRPIGTWLLLIPCFWGLALAAFADGFGLWDLWLAVSCSAGAFLMRGAGCTWNDITDRHIDGAVARTKSRPLPSGAVTVKQALAWMVGQMLIAALILFSYNWLAIGLGIGSLALVAVYPFAKRFTWWPQVFLGLAFNFGAILLFAAHAGTVRLPAVLLYGAGIAWTLYYDTIYAHQDREDDALIGVKSTARLFGAASRLWLRAFLLATLVLLAAAVLLTPAPAAMAPTPRVLRVLLALGGVAGFGWHMAVQMRQLNVDDAASCLRVFRANRNAGLIPALFLAVAVFV